jgi:Raf kinase inhibitor-like YbhB/YbcL family protein
MANAQQTTRNNPSARGLPQEFRLSSPAFADGAAIPARHAADQQNVSPRLTWSEAPHGTESFALACEDPDAPKGTFVHWLLWNIDAARSELPEGIPASPDGSNNEIEQGRNGYGEIGYGGPKPPPGPPHRYNFRLYALDARLELESGATRAEFDAAIEAHVLGEARLTGMYAR